MNSHRSLPIQDELLIMPLLMIGKVPNSEAATPHEMGLQVLIGLFS